MPTPSFHDWLRSADEAPATDRLATLIAQCPAGVSLSRLRRLCGLPPETLQDVLKALVATGQVVLVKAGGEMVYRATG